MDVPSSPTPDEILLLIDDEIRAVHLEVAKDTVARMLRHERYNRLAQVWLRLMLMHFIDKKDAEGQKALESARTCRATYTPRMEGDFFCEWALFFARDITREWPTYKSPQMAAVLAQLALGIAPRVNDTNWAAWAESVHARALLSEVGYVSAYRAAAKAENAWRALENPARERRATNRIYLLVAGLMSGDVDDVVRGFVQEVMAQDNNTDRRIAALRIGSALVRDMASRRLAAEEIMLVF